MIQISNICLMRHDSELIKLLLKNKITIFKNALPTDTFYKIEPKNFIEHTTIHLYKKDLYIYIYIYIIYIYIYIYIPTKLREHATIRNWKSKWIYIGQFGMSYDLLSVFACVKQMKIL
jgi:hypothetical protein